MSDLSDAAAGAGIGTAVAGPVGTIVGGAIGLIGGILQQNSQNAYTTQNNQANMQFQLQMQQQQEAYNQQMWAQNNEYNLPVNQVARLEQAGLNPALEYGSSGAVSGNLAAPVIQAPSVDYHPVQKTAGISAAIQDAVGNYNTIRTADAQVNQSVAVANNLHADTQLKGIQMGLISAQTDNTDANTNLVKAQTNISVASLDNVKAELGKINADALLADAQTANQQFQVHQGQTMLPFQAAAVKQSVQEAQARTQLLFGQNAREQAMLAPNIQTALANIVLAQSGAAKNDAEAANIRALAAGIQSDNTLKQVDVNLAKNGITKNDPGWWSVLVKILSPLGSAVDKGVGTAVDAVKSQIPSY